MKSAVMDGTGTLPRSREGGFAPVWAPRLFPAEAAWYLGASRLRPAASSNSFPRPSVPMRRTLLSLLLAAAALAASPLTAPSQTPASGGTPFRAPGFEAVVPPGFEVVTRDSVPSPQGLVSRVIWKRKNTVLAVGEMVIPASAALLDTTVEVRHIVLASTAQAALRAYGFLSTGEPEEITTPTHVGQRVRFTAKGEDGRTGSGVTEFLLSRRGPLRMVTASYLTVPPASRVPAEALAFLGSLRVLEVADPRPTTDVLAWLEGRWRWTEPADGKPVPPFLLSVSADRRAVTLHYDAPIPGQDGRERSTFTYRVAGQGPHHVRGEIEGETRTTAAGKPAVWDFVRLSADSFCWREASWSEGSCTRPLVRIPDAPK